MNARSLSGAYAASQRHVEVLPRTFQRGVGNGNPGVLFCPGHGAGAYQGRAYPYTLHIVRALVGAGYPYMSIDAQGDSWGNDAAIADVEDGVDYLEGTIGAVDDVFLIGFSMGALAVLNFARANLARVRAVALICPMVAMDWANDNSTPAYAPGELATVYGGGYEAALATHDPSAYAAELVDLPGKVWRASDDTSVPPAQVDAFAAAAEFEVRNLGATGHTPLPVDASEVVAFFAAHA